MPRIQESLTKTGPVHNITIPKAIMTFKGWKKGNRIDFLEKNGEVVLRRVE